jgi:hypothetical protein
MQTMSQQPMVKQKIAPNRIVLGIEYNGSLFSGYQLQSHGTRTVQGELEKALSKVANETIRLTCAGRTDTGVHATGQVVHFDTTGCWEAICICRTTLLFTGYVRSMMALVRDLVQYQEVIAIFYTIEEYDLLFSSRMWRGHMKHSMTTR